jgi:hypothetical protein
MPPRKTRNSKREMFVSLSDVKQVLDDVPSLKIKSAKTYISHLKLFMTEMKIDNVHSLLNDFMKTDEYIQNKTSKRSGGKPITLETMRTYYVTINSLSLHVDFVKKQAKDFWQQRQDEYNKKCHEERAKNKVLKKHGSTPPKWSDLKVLPSQFTNGSKFGVNHLVVSMYTLIPPRRGEYRTLMYLDKKPEANDAAVRPRKSTNELRDSNKVPWNYVHPNDDGTFTIVLRDFKTNQTYDTYEKVLPEDLSAIIKGYIDKQKIEPNSVIFHTNRDRKERGEPWVPLKDGNWSNKVTNAFKVKYDKHSIAIDELRHAFINSLKLNDMTTEEKETIALAMGHSTRYQDLYRQYVTDEEPVNDEPPAPPTDLEQLYAMLGRKYMEARELEALIQEKLNQSS